MSSKMTVGMPDSATIEYDGTVKLMVNGVSMMIDGEGEIELVTAEAAPAPTKPKPEPRTRRKLSETVKPGPDTKVSAEDIEPKKRAPRTSPAERAAEVAVLVRSMGELNNQDLAQALGVSTVTVNQLEPRLRDLGLMEKEEIGTKMVNGRKVWYSLVDTSTGVPAPKEPEAPSFTIKKADEPPFMQQDLVGSRA